MTNKHLNTNQALYLASDVIDLMDCCMGDIQIGITNEETMIKLGEIVKIVEQIEGFIKENESIEG